MPNRTVFERSRRELSLDVSVDVLILLVVEQSILESQSRGCAKTQINRVFKYCLSGAFVSKRLVERTLADSNKNL